MTIQPGLISSGARAGASLVKSDLSQRLAEFIQLARQQEGATERQALASGMTPGGTAGVNIGGQEWSTKPVDPAVMEALQGGGGGMDISYKSGNVTMSKKAQKKMTLPEAMRQAQLMVSGDKDLQIGMLEHLDAGKKQEMAQTQQERENSLIEMWAQQGLIDMPQVQQAGGQETPAPAGTSPGQQTTDQMAGQAQAGKIMVRLKVAQGQYPAGTPGEIDANEFDPNIHERI